MQRMRKDHLSTDCLNVSSTTKKITGSLAHSGQIEWYTSTSDERKVTDQMAITCS